MNYFAYSTAAERYARGRPFFHPLAIEKIREHCCGNHPINQALDVACGTGQSTMALLEIATEVVGLDSSPEMLSHAPPHPHIRYVEGVAEQMPFNDATFGLVTVSSAFHWLDHRQFLREARRVLRPRAWLVIYTDGFTGRMDCNPDCERWNREQYLTRYPSPPRNNFAPTETETLALDFEPPRLAKFEHAVKFTPDQLVGYLLTQTNVIAAVEAGEEDLQSVTRWLTNSVQPMFASRQASFQFACEMRFFERG